MTTKQTAERAAAYFRMARFCAYGQASCALRPGDICPDPAPSTYAAAQAAAGADAETAARVARHRSVIAASAVAAHCFAALDATFVDCATVGFFGVRRATKAIMRAIEAHDEAIEGLRVSLDAAHADDQGNPTTQKLITPEDEKTYGRDLIDLAKRAATEAMDLELIAFAQEYLSQCAARGGTIARATPIPPPTKLITPEDEQTYGSELIDLFKRAAREDAVLDVNKIRQELLSQFAELRADIARGIISPPTSRASFAVGNYRLDASIDGLTGLVEFLPGEYETMDRQFESEKNYNAPPVNFLGRTWNLQIGTAQGKIYKIAPYLVLASKVEANPIAMETLQYCSERLGKPAEQKTGLFVWDTTDGNVILQTRETAEALSIALFLTSRTVRNLKRL